MTQSFVTSCTRFIGATFLAIGLLAASAGAQPGLSLQGDPAAGGAPSEAKQLSPADQSIKSAFQRTKNASTVDDFTQIIALCKDGLDQGATGESAAYAKKLQGWAHNRRGEKYAESGDEKKALQEFELAISADPRLWKAIHNRGVSKAALRDLKGAMADFDQVVQMNSGYGNAWFNRGELKYEQGDFAGAMQDYDRAIQIKPNDAGFYNSRGHANYRMGRFREALSDYNRAVRIDPNDAGALVNRGDAYREQAVYGPAATDYRQAIQIDPKLGRAYLSAAWLMATCPDQRYRDAERAVSSAQKAIELDGDSDYRYLDTLAAAQASAGKFDEAKASAARAVASAPSKEIAKVRQRLELYETNRAYREGGPAEPVRAATRTQ